MNALDVLCASTQLRVELDAPGASRLNLLYRGGALQGFGVICGLCSETPLGLLEENSFNLAAM
jgi:hypothetical protein